MTWCCFSFFSHLTLLLLFLIPPASSLLLSDIFLELFRNRLNWNKCLCLSCLSSLGCMHHTTHTRTHRVKYTKCTSTNTQTSPPRPWSSLSSTNYCHQNKAKPGGAHARIIKQSKSETKWRLRVCLWVSHLMSHACIDTHCKLVTTHRHGVQIHNYPSGLVVSVCLTWCLYVHTLCNCSHTVHRV